MPCPTHVRTPWAGSNREARLPQGWKRTRARILRRDHHYCQWVMDGGQRCRARATEVDHIDNHGPDDDWNLRALCTPHHRAKSSAEGHAARRAMRLDPDLPAPPLHGGDGGH